MGTEVAMNIELIHGKISRCLYKIETRRTKPVCKQKTEKVTILVCTFNYRYMCYAGSKDVFLMIDARVRHNSRERNPRAYY
jgi:UDP-N-acetylenolpyruvoylglucosamine reductase